jgi:hypothetical protein
MSAAVPKVFVKLQDVDERGGTVVLDSTERHKRTAIFARAVVHKSDAVYSSKDGVDARS